MDIKSPRGREKSAEHPKLDAKSGKDARAEAAVEAVQSATAPLSTNPQEESHGPDQERDRGRHAFKKLDGHSGRRSAHFAAGPSADALWSRETRGARRAKDVQKDIEKVETELDQTQQDIDRAAERLERMWKRNGPKFRAEVLKELEAHGNIPPGVKDRLADELSELRFVERMLARTRNPHRRAELEARHAKLSESLSQVLTENGLELELLKAVERAADEDGEDGSLTDLMTRFERLSSKLKALTAELRMLELMDQINTERREADAIAKAAAKVDLIKGNRLAEQVRKELARLMEAVPPAEL